MRISKDYLLLNHKNNIKRKPQFGIKNTHIHRKKSNTLELPGLFATARERTYLFITLMETETRGSDVGI